MALAKPPEAASHEFKDVISYDLQAHLSKKGSGCNLLRTELVAQPRTLRPGDILATGDRVLALPRDGGNGRVWVLLSGGLLGNWVDMASRLPLALLSVADQAIDGLVAEMRS
jgi:hypothetical protein